MKKQIFLIFLYFLPIALPAQKMVENESQTWLGVFSQVRWTDRWGLWFDAHLRLRDDFVGDWSQAILRPGLTWYLADDVRLTAGYAYVHHFPAEGHSGIARPEHRPWQQIQWFAKFPKARFMQWVRLEERYRRKLADDDRLAEGYNFNYRVRFNVALFVPLTRRDFGRGGWQLLLNNEAHVNFGEEIVYNYFDQNRLFAGLVYQATDHSQIHAGYMRVYQQLPAGNKFKNLNAIRLFYFHNFDLRSEHSQPKKNG
jgi:hypothetical protein